MIGEKVAIVGSRDYPHLGIVRSYVKFLDRSTIVVTGGADGVDKAAEKTALDCGLTVIVHIADWRKYGNSAGPIRNQAIVNDADRVVAFWDGSSRGTRDTIRKAMKAHIPVIIIDQNIVSSTCDKLP